MLPSTKIVKCSGVTYTIPPETRHVLHKNILSVLPNLFRHSGEPDSRTKSAPRIRIDRDTFKVAEDLTSD